MQRALLHSLERSARRVHMRFVPFRLEFSKIEPTINKSSLTRTTERRNRARQIARSPLRNTKHIQNIAVVWRRLRRKPQMMKRRNVITRVECDSAKNLQPVRIAWLALKYDPRQAFGLLCITARQRLQRLHA